MRRIRPIMDYLHYLILNGYRHKAYFNASLAITRKFKREDVPRVRIIRRESRWLKKKILRTKLSIG